MPGILTLFQKLWSSVPLVASVVLVWLDCSCMTMAVLHNGKMLHNWLRSFSFDSSCLRVKEVTIHLWPGRGWTEIALNLKVEVSRGSKVTYLLFIFILRQTWFRKNRERWEEDLSLVFLYEGRKEGPSCSPNDGVLAPKLREEIGKACHSFLPQREETYNYQNGQRE